MIDKHIDEIFTRLGFEPKSRAKVALIGGSGINDSPGFENIPWTKIYTGFSNGFGKGVVECQIRDDGAVFIPRHGNKQRFAPSRTQYGANLLAAKILGAEYVIATSAVGSLKKYLPVESLVLPDDFKDESGRDDNIFETGIVIHANMRPAFSESLRKILICSAKNNLDSFNGVYTQETYVTIPGDRFGTTAEGRARSQYADIVGMTLCPEASMAVQLDLHYASISIVVDKDSDANHEGSTLEIMNKLSKPNILPKYVEEVVQKTLDLDYEKSSQMLPQLKGNIIPGNTNHIKNSHLRRVADELIRKYV